MFKKVLFILLISGTAFYISLPSTLLFFGKKVNRPNLNLNIGSINIVKEFDLKLGLDLAGGSRLVFEADTDKVPPEKRKDSLLGVRDIIERRINLFGVSEPSVQTSNFEGKDRIIVELPGLKDTREAVDLIGQTAQLAFNEIEDVLDETTSSPSSQLVPTDLDGSDLESADVVFDSQTGKPAISLQFSREGGDKFAKITERNIGKPLPVILDNIMITSPMVQETITGGTAQITGNFSVDEAKQLSIQLNAGALPIPVFLVEEKTVEATLGETSVKKSVLAGAVGLFMVSLFMIFNYGRLGLIANIGLVIFAILSLAIYKIIPIVLTLPGIAGFMLSIGMAVDSNILIFERFREEKNKRNITDALEISFGKAWDSIRDANVATIIISLVLMNPMDWSFLQSSGPVRGFAITLLLGIVISLFTGLFVSRNLLRLFIREENKLKIIS